MSDIIISVRNAGKRYRSFASLRARILGWLLPRYSSSIEEFHALRDVSFDIRRGEAVAIIGRNGSGKSTLLEILTHTSVPTTGTVAVHGRVSALLELGSSFNPEYSGRDNVILNGLLLGLKRSEILARFAEIEAFAEIGSAIDKPVKTYSSGMMMRLAFAVQVLTDPDILIIDEALSVGDFFFQQKCLGFIRELCARGTTLLFVSHDMGTVRDLCRRGLLLQNGNLVFDGDNIEAIRRYLLNSSIEITPEASGVVASTEDYHSLKRINSPLWVQPLRPPQSAQILEIGFQNKSGQPCTSVRLGNILKIQILFRALKPDDINVTLGFKNKHNHLVTAVSTMTMKTPWPVPETDFTYLLEITISMNLEAGAYGAFCSISEPSADKTTGTILDEVNDLGPLLVEWNYDSEPPPFFGMIGLPVQSTFN